MKVLRNPWKLKQKDEMRKYFEIVYDSVRKEIYEKWNFCGCMKYIKLLQEYEIWMFLKSFTKVWNITLYHKHIKYESILQFFY